MSAQRFGVVLLGTALVLCASSAAGAGAPAPAWTPTAVLSDVGASQPQVGLDAQGNATVVWATKAGTNDGVVQARFRPAGGRFGPVEDVSPPGLWTGPDLAVDPTGNATVVWAAGTAPSVVVRAAERPAGGRFGAAHDLAPPVNYVSAVRVGADANGGTVAMWVGTDGDTATVRAAFRAQGGSFGPPEPVSTVDAQPQQPTLDLAVAPNGDAVAAWVASRGSASLVQAAFRPPGGSFGPPETLAEATGLTEEGRFTYVANADVAIDRRGNATVVWTDTGAYESRVRPAASGVWEPTQVVTQVEGCCPVAPSLAVDPDGNATAAWVSADNIVQVSTRPAGSSSWGAAQAVSQPGDTYTVRPSLAVGAAGDTLLAWPSFGGIRAAHRPSGGSFGAPGDVSQAGPQVLEPPDLAVDAHGNAVAVWLSTRSVLPRYSYRRYVNTADYDTAAPELSALQVPVSGRPGVRLRFSATPVDSWSGVASTRWRFGDGATAAGRAASHVYKRSGTYRVTVIATDRAGHSTSSTRTLRIR